MKKKLSNKSIFENPELYKLLFENSLDAILLTSPDGSIYKVNPAACRIFNFTENELIKRGRNAVIDLSDPRLKKALNKRTREEKFFGELTFIRKGGEKFPGEISTSIFKDAEGNKKTSMVIRDITEREIANRNLIKTNRIYAVISQINQLIVREKNKNKLLDEVCNIVIEQGKFRFAWIGFVDSKRNIIKPFAWAGDENSYLSKIKKSVFNNEEPAAKVIIQKKFKIYNKISKEKDRPWKNKAVKRGYKSIAAFPIKLKKKVVGVFCLYSSEDDSFDKEEIKLLKETTSNISFALEVLKVEEERKQFEKALLEKEQLLSESQRIAHIGGWSWDLSGPIKWTDETYRICGVSPETFIPTAKSFINLLHPDDRLLMQQWVEACAAGEKPGELDVRSILPDGSIRFLRGRGKLIYETKKGHTFMAGTVQDITERKKVEETLRTSESQFRELWKATVEGIVILDQDIILEVNWAEFLRIRKKLMGYLAKAAVRQLANHCMILHQPKHII